MQVHNFESKANSALWISILLIQREQAEEMRSVCISAPGYSLHQLCPGGSQSYLKENSERDTFTEE